MNDRSATTTRAAWAVFTAIAVLSGLSVVLGWRDVGILPLVGVAIAGVGTLILVRAGNPLGWLFDLAAGCILVESLSSVYLYARATSQPGLPAAGYAAILGSAAVIPVVTAFALLVLWFPTGRPPSRRWTPVGWVVIVSSVFLVLSVLLKPGTTDANHAEGIANPLGVASFAGLATAIGRISGLALVAGGLACVASVFVRFHHSTGEEREQLRWLAAAVSLALVLFILAGAVEATHGPDLLGAIGWIGFLVSMAIGIPGAITVAVLKYHLYDIDIVISKTIVYGLLAVFIGAVYVAIVVGVSAVIPVSADSALLSIAATGLVAFTFQPVRERVQKFANRLVFGRRSTPYEVLTRFSDRVGDTYATEDVLPRTAQVIAEGVNAERATIWLHLADDLRPTAGWPDISTAATAVPLPVDVGEELPPLPGAHVAAVRYQGELLGAISVEKRQNEPMTHEDVKLVDDLAAQAGLVVANVRLTADLEARLDVIARQAAELRAARQRIVVAQDAERRRLERNIHDGAQQHLVALAVKLRLTKGLFGKDPTKARALLAEIRQEAGDAIDTLRDLSRGIYPAVLEDQGVAAALAAQYARSGIPVHLSSDGIHRYPIEVEAAIYFSCLEALQNASKYSGATSIQIKLGEVGSSVEFEVRDDGVGFNPAATPRGTGLNSIADRLAVLGGDVEVGSEPGRGTTVRGRLPVGAAEALR